MDNSPFNHSIYLGLVLHPECFRIQFVSDQGISDFHATCNSLGRKEAGSCFRSPAPGNLVGEFSETNAILGRPAGLGIL